MSAPVGCWYCHATGADPCPKCLMTAKERQSQREFYDSFRPVPVTEVEKRRQPRLPRKR